MKYLKKYWSPLLLVVFLGICLLVLLQVSNKNPEWSEETVTIKLAEQLPDYSTSSDWVKGYDFYFTAPKDVVEVEYTMPTWHHPPLVSALLWPFVRITQDVYLLRGITMALFLGAIILVYLSMRKQTKMAIAFLPVILLFPRFFRGGVYLYHDAFMVFFFALTWYLVTRKSNWKYLAACALVLTKTPAVLFLIPLVLKDKNWKLFLPALTLIPWYVAGSISNRDVMWLPHHWMDIRNAAAPTWGERYNSQIWPYLKGYLALTVPVVLVVKKYYAELTLLLLVLALNYGWFCIDYQALPMLIVLPLVFRTWLEPVIKNGWRYIRASYLSVVDRRTDTSNIDSN